jgi:hypothetical protein
MPTSDPSIHVVSSATRPEVEIAFQAKSADIRFSKKKVAKTIPNIEPAAC